MKNFILALVACFVFLDMGYSQSRPNPTCNHNAILVVIRAYEDSLALAKSGPVVREDYTLPGSSSTTSSDKGYKLYRCPALLDSLTVLIGEVMFARASPPVVVTDSISGVTETAAVFHAKVTSNGGQAVTAQWFRYGTSAASLVDSVAVAGTATPFTASLSTLTAGTTYYVAGFARNEKGTSSGDTLTFTTLSVPSVDTDDASDLAVTSATLNATFTDFGTAVTATGFKYGTDAALSSPTDVAGSGTTSPFTAALTGLTASTQYWAVGYATNALGTSYGDTITFTTWAVPAVFNSCGDQIGYYGHNYTTALIGSQCWFAENLRNYNYNDGTVIPGDLDNATWKITTSGAQTVYGEGGGNEAANLATYGRLYNWHAVNTGNLCPSGWHVPTDAEWTTLVTGLGASAGDQLKASSPDWDGTDFVGFSAVPGGYRSRLGNFSEEGNAGWWWTATSLSGTAARDHYLVTGDSDVKTYSTENILFGFSVRCVQDPPTAPTVDTDAASSVTSSAATLNATITSTGGTAVTATGFKYGTDALLTSPTDVAGSGTTSPFTAALTGLTHSTQYWAVGYATNGVGTSYGDTITFSTLAIAPTVDTDAAGSVTDTEATLNATFTDGGSAVTATGFKYGTDAALSSPTDVAGSGTTSPFTAALTGLTATTQYWAVGYATNGVGTSYGDTITFTTSAFSCGTSTVTYDEHSYSTVLIGSQCWFKENLRNDNYNDGTPIPGNLSDELWPTTSSGAQTVYGEGSSTVYAGSSDEVANLATYGRLYNWYAVNTGNLCPSGWHVPTDAEWTTLETAVSSSGDALKSSTGWISGDLGTNSSGFSALPGGQRIVPGGFGAEGSAVYFWSSSSSSETRAWMLKIEAVDNFIYRDTSVKRLGYSVRCVQDPLTAPTVDTDAASSVTLSAATLNATFTDGGSAVTATGFKYGTDALLTSPTDVAGSGTTSPFTAALTGLTASTQYWAVGYATNAVGTSYGDTITFTSAPTSCSVPSVTYDGYTYTTVSIGTQCWFKENLRNDNYADGTAISGGLSNTAWVSVASGAFTISGEGGANEATNLAAYGRLYNWYAVTEPAGLCPTGWHVPTDAEWTTLVTELGGAAVAGAKLKVSSSNTPAWDGDNTSGFSALPGGFRFSADGDFYYRGARGYWWSSSPDGTYAWIRQINTSGSNVHRGSYDPLNGFSVRCLQDPPTAPTVDTDAAGAVTETEATLNATFTDGGSAVTATGFKYGTDALLTSPTDVAGSGTSSPFTAALTGLTASTQYWAVGYATNALGTSYGDTITFTTSAAPSFNSCGDSYSYQGHNYATVQIGSQCWFAENLQSSSYNDGTAIPAGLDGANWSSTAIGAVAAYNDDESNVAISGRLYNWYAVNTDLLCPTGWHVPLNVEFNALATGLGGTSNAGGAMKSSASDSPAWNGTNTSRFSAVLTGVKEADGTYDEVTTSSYMWASDLHIGGSPQWWVLYGFHGTLVSTLGNKNYGLPVRCLQDPPTAPTVDTDAAGSVTETEATLTATYTDGGSAVTATGFKYGTDAALSSPTDVAGSGTTSPFTAALTGLTASTQYWAVGYATNSVGTSYGDTITFTTSAAVPVFTCGTSTVTYDGHNYTTVLIGTQCWFKENLRNDDYNDGTPIPGNLDNSTWTTTNSGAQAVYGQGDVNEGSNLATYGRLYNWYAVNTGILCPSGWHVPTDSEWTTLTVAFGGASSAGTKLKASSSDTPAWNGDNSSGFSALPGGFRYNDYGDFDLQGDYGCWWSSSPNGSYAWSRYLYSANSSVASFDDNTRYGYSVRCVRD